MRFWGNLLGYQLVWFIAVQGAGGGAWWPGVAAAALFIAWQMLLSGQPGAELRLLCAAVCCGVLADGVLSATAWASYAAPDAALPPGGAPVWILALWASFAMTVNHTLVYLRERPWLALLFGAIGAPVAYASAARGWHALVFEAPAWRGLVWIGFSWAVAMPVLALLARRWARTNGAPLLAPPHGEAS
jgi:hypothetical protein